MGAIEKAMSEDDEDMVVLLSEEVSRIISEFRATGTSHGVGGEVATPLSS
jgi:hypothetical protein